MTTWEEEITRAHPLLLCMPRSGWEATVIFYGWLPLPPKMEDMMDKYKDCKRGKKEIVFQGETIEMNPFLCQECKNFSTCNLSPAKGTIAVKYFQHKERR